MKSLRLELVYRIVDEVKCWFYSLIMFYVFCRVEHARLVDLDFVKSAESLAKLSHYFIWLMTIFVIWRVFRIFDVYCELISSPEYKSLNHGGKDENQESV